MDDAIRSARLALVNLLGDPTRVAEVPAAELPALVLRSRRCRARLR